MTNEFVFGYTFIGFPNVFAGSRKVDRTQVGYNYKGSVQERRAQIPSFGGWGGGEAALVFNPGGFEAGGPQAGLYANKYMPSVSDTVTKVVGTHTIKGGGLLGTDPQCPAGQQQHQRILAGGRRQLRTLLGNAYADLLTGTLNSYQETSFNRINDISYNTYEGFVQDSWKVSRRLTLELGLRADALPALGRPAGLRLFHLRLFQVQLQLHAAAVLRLRMEQEAIRRFRSAGFPTRALFWQPRFGVAYDIGGKGKTVLRGGWGRYYYHSGQFTAGLDVSAGVVSRSLGNNVNGVPLLARNSTR